MPTCSRVRWSRPAPPACVRSVRFGPAPSVPTVRSTGPRSRPSCSPTTPRARGSTPSPIHGCEPARRSSSEPRPTGSWCTSCRCCSRAISGAGATRRSSSSRPPKRASRVSSRAMRRTPKRSSGAWPRRSIPYSPAPARTTSSKTTVIWAICANAPPKSMPRCCAISRPRRSTHDGRPTACPRTDSVRHAAGAVVDAVPGQLDRRAAARRRVRFDPGRRDRVRRRGRGDGACARCVCARRHRARRKRFRRGARPRIPRADRAHHRRELVGQRGHVRDGRRGLGARHDDVRRRVRSLPHAFGRAVRRGDRPCRGRARRAVPRAPDAVSFVPRLSAGHHVRAAVRRRRRARRVRGGRRVVPAGARLFRRVRDLVPGPRGHPVRRQHAVVVCDRAARVLDDPDDAGRSAAHAADLAARNVGDVLFARDAGGVRVRRLPHDRRRGLVPLAARPAQAGPGTTAGADLQRLRPQEGSASGGEGGRVAQTLPLPPAVGTVRSSIRIASIGTYLPQKRLTNADLSRLVDTDDPWIVRRTGIRERRIAEPDEYTSDLCMAAVGDMQARGGSLEGVDYVIACTSTPDYGFPSVATRLQHRLGLRNVGAVDVTAACAGFTYGLDVADALVNSGRARKVLVAAGETMSKVMDYTDRGTCILFGDGAAVVLVDAPEDAPPTLLARRATSDGSLGKELFLTNLRTEIAGVVEPERYLRQNGRAGHEWAGT